MWILKCYLLKVSARLSHDPEDAEDPEYPQQPSRKYGFHMIHYTAARGPCTLA